jgi:hypothetical protein
MKKLYPLIIFSILIFLTSCKFEKNNDPNTDVKFEKSELFGYWIRTDEMDELENSKDVIVRKFNIKEDSTAEIEILDSIGRKTVTGSWKIGEEQKIIGSLSFKSDFALTFWSNPNYMHMISFSVEKRNDKIILNSQGVIFEKE